MGKPRIPMIALGVGVGLFLGLGYGLGRMMSPPIPMMMTTATLNPTAAPASTAQNSFEHIYNRLNTGVTTAAVNFTEPASGPGTGTMHTLDEIYNLAALARVAKTGQTTSYATADDGNLVKGLAWPNPRFTDNGDGTVTGWARPPCSGARPT